MRRVGLFGRSTVAAALLGGTFVGCGASTEGDALVIPADAGADGDARTDVSVGEGGKDARVDATSDASPDAPEVCPTASFLNPSDGAMLTEVDDKDHDYCVNGFQLDVQVTTSAKDGTSA